MSLSLRPFNRTDHEVLGRLISAHNPWICELPGDVGLVVVLDHARILVIIGNEAIYSARLPNPACARAVANATVTTLDNAPGHHIACLQNLGFKLV